MSFINTTLVSNQCVLFILNFTKYNSLVKVGPYFEFRTDIALVALMRFLKKNFFFFIFLSGCIQVKNPEFRRIDHFRLKNIGWQQATIGFAITYYNPNNFGVSVKEAEADVYMDSVYLGKFVQDSVVAVARNAGFSIPFSGAITLGAAMKIDFKNLPEKEISFRADGSVKLGKAGVFISKPFHYQGRHRLNDIEFLN